MIIFRILILKIIRLKNVHVPWDFSDTLVTPTDVKLVQAIEDMIGTDLKELEVDEKAIEEIILQVSVTKREQVQCFCIFC